MNFSVPTRRPVPLLHPISSCLGGEEIGHRIRAIRGHLVLFDTDLAEILGLPAEQLGNELRRHEPLPGDFWFLLEPSESVLSSVYSRGPGRERPQLAFTEHGALLAAAFLGTPEAIAVGVRVVRAFVRRRQLRNELGNRLGENSEARKP